MSLTATALLSCVLMFFAVPGTAAAQTGDGPAIDALFQELRQTLISRATPERFLVPSIASVQRQQEAQKAVRPYVSLTFKYNLADLQAVGPNAAKLPLMFEWQTARATGNISGTAEFQKVGGKWYFKNFDSMSFPWAVVILGSSVGIAFAAVVLYFYYRSKKRRLQPVPA